ncbi:MAG TPA: PEP-CTERM sorting domain-containing protein [Burkholderiaceae bacterium]|nr:PEP-CTERM sorting domain-containing protein [Burkholderiaceae bacterium]
MNPLKTLTTTCVAVAALACAASTAQAAACATFGAVAAGTASTEDVTYNGADSDACVISGVNPQQGPNGNTSGFASSLGSGWSLLAKIDGSGNVSYGSLPGITFSSSISGIPGTSGTWTLSADQAVTLDLVFAMHGSNRSGAFLFDDLSIGSSGSGTWEINWPNNGGNIPNYSNLTLFVRDVVVTPVPEPETYALMLAGLGAIGFMARRRRT